MTAAAKSRSKPKLKPKRRTSTPKPKTIALTKAEIAAGNGVATFNADMQRPCPDCGAKIGVGCRAPDGRWLHEATGRGLHSHLARRSSEATDNVACPSCKVRAGERCKSGVGAYLKDGALVHPKRWRAWERVQKARARDHSTACIECKHERCPITPSCAACPECIEERTGKPPASTGDALARAESFGTKLAAKIDIRLIRRDGNTQTRASMSAEAIAEYAEVDKADTERLPPIDVFFDTSAKTTVYWLADGFHRLAAWERNGHVAVRAVVHRGGKREAFLWSCKANNSHGLRRSNADKRHTLSMFFADEEWRKKTDRWIADEAGVSHEFVRQERARLFGGQVSTVDTSDSETRVGKDGKSYPASQPSRSPAPSSTTQGQLFDDPKHHAAPPPEAPPKADRTPQPGETILANFAGEWRRVQVHRIDAHAEPTIVAIVGSRIHEWLVSAYGTAWEWPADDERNEPRPSPPAIAESDQGSEPLRTTPQERPESSPPVAQDLVDARPFKRRWRGVLGLPEEGKLAAAAVVDAYRARLRLSVDELQALGITPEDISAAKAHGLSQWFTGVELADKMVSVAGLLVLAKKASGPLRAESKSRPLRVLEPSAGGGALIAACARVVESRSLHVTAYEIDPELSAALEQNKSVNEVVKGDFLSAAAPEERFDIGIANTPSERGLDGAFLAKMMDICNRIAVLLRTNALHGQGREDLVWSRVKRGEWQLADLVYCAARETFEGPGDDSALSDYVIVHLVRTPTSAGKRAATNVDWWSKRAIAAEDAA